jgi:hypothetical protein
MFKFHYGELPNIFKDFYTHKRNIHPHCTRQQELYHPLLVHSLQAQRTTRIAGVSFYNYFSSKILIHCSLMVYKRNLKKYIIEHDVSSLCKWLANVPWMILLHYAVHELYLKYQYYLVWLRSDVSNKCLTRFVLSGMYLFLIGFCCHVICVYIIDIYFDIGVAVNRCARCSSARCWFLLFYIKASICLLVLKGSNKPRLLQPLLSFTLYFLAHYSL